MTKCISDIDILQKEISKNETEKPAKKTRKEAIDDEFFAFLEPDVEPDYSVGIFTTNKISDESL